MINKNKPTRTLIVLMSVLVLIAYFILKGYYKNQNASVDPRIVPARTLYESYNAFTTADKLDSVFWLMDTIEGIYTSVPHYQNSYEIGVLYNNRAAAWLTIALYSEFRDSLERDSLVMLASKAVDKSISIYTDWDKRYGTLSEEEILTNIQPSFMEGLTSYSGIEKNKMEASGKEENGRNDDIEKDIEKFLNTRVNEILNSQIEIERRLSVSYTNLGIIHRYNVHYDSAVQCYEKALDLWDRNLTAKNNMNFLLDRPMEKQNIIQKLFPPERID